MTPLDTKPLNESAAVEVQELCILALRQNLREFDWNSLSLAIAHQIHALLPNVRGVRPAKWPLIPERYFIGDFQKHPVNASRTYTSAEALAQIEYEMKKDDRDLYVWSISEASDAAVHAA